MLDIERAVTDILQGFEEVLFCRKYVLFLEFSVAGRIDRAVRAEPLEELFLCRSASINVRILAVYS